MDIQHLLKQEQSKSTFELSVVLLTEMPRVKEALPYNPGTKKTRPLRTNRRHEFATLKVSASTRHKLRENNVVYRIAIERIANAG